jgi:hypothetical protein
MIQTLREQFYLLICIAAESYLLFVLVSVFCRRNTCNHVWAQPTRLWLVPKIEETTSWETLQKHCGGVLWGDLSNQTHQQRKRPDRNTRLAQTLDRCDKAQWRLHWRPVNVFCKINSFLKSKYTMCRIFEMTHVYMYILQNGKTRYIYILGGTKK